MKKAKGLIFKRFFGFAVLVLFAFILVACNGGSKDLTVTFDSKGGSEVELITVKKGKKVSKPEAPTKAGFAFLNWYLEGSLYDFDEAVNEDLTLVAKWEVTDAVTDLKLSKSEVALDIDEQIEISTTITPSDLEVTVVWSSSDQAVATVNQEGLIKAVAYGETIIKATIGETSATVNVTVKNLEHKVIFNTNEGSLIPIQTVKEGEKVARPNDPTKKGFTFKGWYTAANLALKFDFNEPIKGNTTIYAGWEDIVSFIVFETNGGNELDSIEKIYEEEIKEVDLAITPIKEGHTFEGWYLDSELNDKVEVGFEVITSHVFYAKWEVNSYTVSFVLDNEEEIEDKTLEYGSLIEVSEPIKLGYDFAGWYLDEEHTTVFALETDKVSEDIILYAKWDLGTSTVKFNSNGGSEVADIVVESLKTITKPEDPTFAGMIFGGWYDDEDLIDAFDYQTPILGTITLYARWDLNPEEATKVEFELNGGSFPITSTDFFIRHGFEAKETYSSLIVNGNPWTAATQKNLHFQTTVGTGSYWPKAGLKRNDLGLFEITDFVPSGAIQMGDYDYVLSAWDQAGPAYQFVMSLQIGQIVTITGIDSLDEPNGTILSDAIVNVYNANAAYDVIYTNLLTEVLDLPVPEKENLVFAGWYDNEEFTGEAVTTVTNDIKLYAKWDEE